MARRQRKAVTPFDLWAGAVATGVATAVTLSVRVPRILAGTMTVAESTRMVAEKAAAAAEGLFAGSTAAAQIAARRMARPAPHRAIEDALEIADAMSRPARRRVEANAARLLKR